MIPSFVPHVKSDSPDSGLKSESFIVAAHSPGFYAMILSINDIPSRSEIPVTYSDSPVSNYEAPGARPDESPKPSIRASVASACAICF